MKLTYNKAHVGDTLFVTLKKTSAPVYEHHEGVTLIKDGEEVIGLNIFDASRKLSLDADEVDIEPTESLVDDINSLLSSQNSESIHPDLSPKFVVGYVAGIEQHPDADKLSVCQVDVGDEMLDIVCGAPNVDSGQKVVVAKVGAIMPDGMYIKPSQLRGVASSGMICSKRELDLEDDIEGIYVLDDSYTVGEPFDLK